MSKLCPCRGEKCGERRPDLDEDVPLLKDKVTGEDSEASRSKDTNQFTTSDRKS